MPPVDLTVFQGGLSWKSYILSHVAQLTPTGFIIHLGCVYHSSKRLYVFDVCISNYPQLSHRRYASVSVLVLELVYDLSIFGLIISSISKTTSFNILQTRGMIMHIIVRDGSMYFLWASSTVLHSGKLTTYSKVSSSPRCVCGHLWPVFHRWAFDIPRIASKL